MKKLMILSAILLLVATAYGQRKASEAAREPDRRNERIRSGRTSATVHKKSTARHPEGSAASRRHPTAKVHSNQRHTRQLEARKPGNDQRRKYKTERNQPANRKQAPMIRDLQTRKFSGSHGNEKPLVNRPPSSRYNDQRSNTQRSHRRSQAEYRSKAGHSPVRRKYTTPGRKHVRKQVYHHKSSPVRRVHHYHYRAPRHVHVSWTRSMWREYRVLYPEFRYWYYPSGYTILNVPAYRALGHIGEVRNVYGRVHEIYYSWPTDEYYLYFGGRYPYHDFTVIMKGRHARRFSRNPEYYFEGRYLWVTGLVSTFDGKPEIMVKRHHQVHLY